MNQGTAIKPRKRIHDTAGNRVFDSINIATMLLFCVIILYPVLNVVAISFSADKYIYSGSIHIWPKGFSINAYTKVLGAASIWRGLGNSVFVCVMSCICSLTITSFAAYPLAFGKFYGKKLYTFMIMLTMWFSGGLIPTFMVMSKLKLVNSLWALVVINLVTAYNTVILCSFFRSIPRSLIESASIDGANDFTILFRIVIPVSKAALATVGLWIIVGHWNEFMNPLIYLKDYTSYTLQILLRDVVLTAAADQYGLMMDGDTAHLVPDQIRNATIVVSMLPMLVVYPFLQRYFVKGVMIGSVKE